MYKGHKSIEAYKKYQKEYHAKNRERITERKRAYYAEHKEEHRKVCNEYDARNREAVNAKHKERYYTPKYRFYALKASAKQRGLIVEITFDDYLKITSNLCEYC